MNSLSTNDGNIIADVVDQLKIDVPAHGNYNPFPVLPPTLVEAFTKTLQHYRKAYVRYTALKSPGLSFSLILTYVLFLQLLRH